MTIQNGQSDSNDYKLELRQRMARVQHIVIANETDRTLIRFNAKIIFETN